ncbi:MAG: DUF1282 domain-containing protein [Sphingobacteriales bacterium]|uniref:Yip1 family protein n=1 Tax=Hydrotalea flava TaxID=714549 RepID=UPI00082D1850|nr:Yip1 family protein [Hydrotalea flava]RTL56655.1 MAG: DUF1282 domain-containing protein [Sphingobacteriales bacterium]
MHIVNRVKGIITNPKQEWLTISDETQSMNSVISTYVVPLAIIGALAAFVGYGFVGKNVVLFRMSGIAWGINMAVVHFIAVIITVIVSTFIVDMLATSFGSEKNLNRSAQLVAYSYTPSLIGAFLTVIPALAILGSLFGLYGIYLWYIGLGPIKNTPEDKKATYLIVSIIVLFVVFFIISAIISSIMFAILGLGMYGAMSGTIHFS